VKSRNFIFFFIFLFGWLTSCNNDPVVVHSLGKTETKASETGSNKIGDIKKQKLSSMLYELAVSQDPESFAKTHDILLDKNRVRVYIFFNPTSSDQDRKKILKDHEITIEKSAAGMIRGLVTVDHLISLSQEPAIQSIRLPDRLIETRKKSL
jgi:hypothetical protein